MFIMWFRKVEKSQTRNHLEEDFKKTDFNQSHWMDHVWLDGRCQGHHPSRELKKQRLFILWGVELYLNRGVTGSKT